MEDVKLTKLAKCAGCGAKVGAGTLAKLLDDIKVSGSGFDIFIHYCIGDFVCLF